MAASTSSTCLKSLGLTLIEVLIALAILSIALLAVIKASSEHIRATRYLQQKTIALWVGQLVMNEVWAGLIVLPDAPAVLKQSTKMLNKDWHWQASKIDTANKHISHILVQVFIKGQEESEAPIIDLETDVYHEQKT
jgi:general secretion pathway protein I